MALVEVNTPAFDFARGLAAPAQNAGPHDALARLSRLRDEASRDLHSARFLARAPQACIILLTAGALATLSSANGLMAEFTWAVMLLAGILVTISHHIRNCAAAPPQQSWQAEAHRLRGLLLYMGMAWGSGAFLVLPGQPAPILTFVFAIVPAALLALILKDRRATAAFAVPAAVATVIAAALGGWPQALWIGAAIGAALPGLIAIPALQQKPGPGGLPVP
jgi:hypothetical protein